MPFHLGDRNKLSMDIYVKILFSFVRLMSFYLLHILILFVVIKCFTSIWQEGLAPINLIVETEMHRATPGGTGGVKTIGNYAAVCDFCVDFDHFIVMFVVIYLFITCLKLKSSSYLSIIILNIFLLVQSLAHFQLS